MKILYHHRTRSKDGQHVHIEEMIDALRGLGHEVIVVAPAATEKAEFGSDAGLVSWLKRHLPQFVYELMELSYSLVAYWRMRDAVRTHHPDVLYERYNLLQPAGVWIKQRYRLPLLLEVNSPLFDERVRYDGLSLKRLARWSERYVWRHADYVLPVTRVLGDIVAAAGVPRDRIVVIPNGINRSRFSSETDSAAVKQTLGLGAQCILGFTGFVRDWHGMDKVIDFIAQEQIPCHLLVVGDGPARAALEQQAKALHLGDRVTFTGVIGRDDVARYVAAFDVALQPAVVAYASPLKLFEYLALGRAIVAPDQPNIREVLRDGDNALLFDPSQPGGLVEAIRRLVEDEALRNRLALRAAATIDEQNLTWLDNAKRVSELAAATAA